MSERVKMFKFALVECSTFQTVSAANNWQRVTGDKKALI